MKTIMMVVFSLFLTAAGLASGWFARSQSGKGAAPAAPPASESAKADEGIGQRALDNMGVTWKPAQKSEYVAFRELSAVVADLPSSRRPVVARWGGSVVSVLDAGAPGPGGPPAWVGRRASPGMELVEILRAPLPQIDRGLTGEILQAVSEAVHDEATALRSARGALDVATREYERVRELNREAAEGLPVIPRQTEINLQYDMLRAKAEVERIQTRLRLHGLTEEEIEAVASGASITPASDAWKRALERNGLWPATGAEVLARLPEQLRNHPWTFAGIGELNARCRCDAALIAMLDSVKGLGDHFHELVALIQLGHSLEDVADLHQAGFLDPVVRVLAPAGPPSWEVREVLVRPGDKVEAGATLMVLADPRRMALEVEAPGADAPLVEKAINEATELLGRPLVENAGPPLRGFTLAAFIPSVEAGSGGRGYALVDNEEVSCPHGDHCAMSAWRLRAGQRYLVRFPVKKFPEAFPLPREAVVTEGPDRVVFLRSGNNFARQPVRVLHEDRETVVVADDSALFPGDPVVVTGAFGLSLALRASATTGGAEREGSEHKHGPT